jgi:alanine racemase
MAGATPQVWVAVDEAAIAHNARVLRQLVAPAQLCAVVKADGYGHSARIVARAAEAGGASWLAVAQVKEGVALRDAGVTLPVLVLAEPPAEQMATAASSGLAVAVYTPEGVAAAAAAAASAGRQVQVHVKVDTGMHRVGAAPAATPGLVRAVLAAPGLEYEGLWTHFAVADEPLDGFTGEQLSCFEKVLAEVARPRLVHAANSAGSIAHPESRLSMVRCGISLYGHFPSPALEGCGVDLRPALSWKARVSHVAVHPAGDRPSYGRLVPLASESVVATVPVGYNDGVPRAYLAAGGEVLIGGRRRRLAGAVTMDQIVVDCGPPAAGPAVRRGDEVVLIGRQGDEEVTAKEWAERLGLITYEVLCGIGPRVARLPATAAP